MIQKSRLRNINERISELIAQKKLDKDGDAPLIQSIFKAEIRLRNTVSHQLDFLAKPGDALAFLADCVNVVALYKKLNN